ncbi:MAG TPA: hypothetical protein VG983_06965 [Caulobacterales bacterium]|nr:hypothetical protein [Caulobacterales bacterium]
MSIAPTAASAISDALSRFDRASTDLVASVSGQSDKDPAQAIAQQVEAKAEFEAGVGTVRIADEMFKALIQIGLETSNSQRS